MTDGWWNSQPARLKPCPDTNLPQLRLRAPSTPANVNWLGGSLKKCEALACARAWSNKSTRRRWRKNKRLPFGMRQENTRFLDSDIIRMRE